MKSIFRTMHIITVISIIGFFTACGTVEANLEIINHYREPIIKIGLSERNGNNLTHDVNIPQGESYIYTPVSGSNRVFVITSDNGASNSIPFYAADRRTVTISLGTDGFLRLINDDL
ncbi:MAG: hypothetical protein FWH38_10045 [Treponema sp.]|nr:hypothetical protein [Treponema sp.]